MVKIEGVLNAALYLRGQSLAWFLMQITLVQWGFLKNNYGDYNRRAWESVMLSSLAAFLRKAPPLKLMFALGGNPPLVLMGSSVGGRG